MQASESKPDTPPRYYEHGNIPIDYLEPEYEPMPEDDHIPEYEPLPEDEPIPEYEPETPTEEYTEDMTDVELEPQQPAASTESVNQRNAPPRIEPAPNQNTHGQAINALQQETRKVAINLPAAESTLLTSAKTPHADKPTVVLPTTEKAPSPPPTIYGNVDQSTKKNLASTESVEDNASLSPMDIDVDSALARLNSFVSQYSFLSDSDQSREYTDKVGPEATKVKALTEKLKLHAFSHELVDSLRDDPSLGQELQETCTQQQGLEI
ncbi:uncharacterized protein LOC131641524 [Vicia villosa]|uniref:uncharacterized protein LOC131641524 n=1 Tax=Vicia villosa TaxID=3911 RepID=UPI00273BB15F|nr:uncharacterized protein LOC131641524 [Vicia villosa]